MATAKLSQVRLSNLLTQALTGYGYSTSEYAAGFAAWKVSANPLRDPYFGKDDPYLRPLRGSKTVLWHVHIRPDGIKGKITDWDRKTREEVSKTSDAVLIYTHELMRGYLLLYVVADKGAHDFANSATPAAAKMMTQLADAAEEFILLGNIVL